MNSGAAPQQRRQVTVLFLDVVGSTALTQLLDPEDVLDVMDGAMRAFTQVVSRHGGRVLQYAGDSVLAAFGADVAHEDDAERAVHAGLALLASAREHAQRVRREHGHDGFDARVGVHTGPVLLGGGVDGDGTIRGFTVNIAARLEQTAPPGRLRISQETWRLVRGVFEVEPQAPLVVKGQDAPLVTYLVQGVRPRAFRVAARGVEGVETPLVGREAEVAQVLSAFERTAAGGGLQSVTLLADAGLGKSRLVQEVQHRIDLHPQSCWLLLGRAQPGSQLQPYGLLRDVLAWRLQVADSAGAEAARAQLVQGLLPFFAADGEELALRQAELLGQAIGMDFSASPRLAGMLRDPRLLRQSALAAFTTYVQRLAASDGSPVVMLLDDLQWTDDASLDWLRHLQTATELPLLLVQAARPALLERQPDWGQAWSRHHLLSLAPLAAAERQVLTQTLLQALPEVPAALHALIDGQAEGNPYYAEELVQMLIDDGVIDTTGEAWQLHEDRLGQARIPATLAGVLQARLDALAVAERRAIRQASIVGPVFWDDALRTIDAAAPAALPALQRKAMVQPGGDSAFADTREHRFHHHLLHQVTYDTLLKAERRSGHALAAQWLAARVGDREAEYLALTAGHYERAGDAERAIDWLQRAAVAAQDRYANALALATLARLLAMPVLTDARRRFELLQRQANIADLVVDRVLQGRVLDDALALAEALDDDAARALVLCKQSLLQDRLQQPARSRELALRARALAESSNAAVPGALAHGQLAWLTDAAHTDVALAHLQQARQWARRAAERRERPGDERYEVMILTVIGATLNNAEDPERAVLALREALALAQRHDMLREAMGCHDWLYWATIKLHDLEAAAHHIDACEVRARDIGAAVLCADSWRKRARVLALQGEHEVALGHATRGAQALAALHNLIPQAWCHWLAAEAHLALGRPAAARQALQEAESLFAQTGSAEHVRECRLLAAEAWRAEGQLAPALALVRAAGPWPADAPLPDEVGAATAAAAAAWRVLAEAGDPQAALPLAHARQLLDLSVARITDPAARQRVLQGDPLHREILAAAPG